MCCETIVYFVLKFDMQAKKDGERGEEGQDEDGEREKGEHRNQRLVIYLETRLL